ncbi:MAG: hypothetical protein DRR19_14020 [Candidatus Parabeggiatoa sp. nov. 1]|nr:MAG: hypothetical protein DRR19_14020 [Gammaproteobacteria bacterium]
MQQRRQDVLTTMRLFAQNFKTTFHPFPKYEGCELCYLQLKNNEITLNNAGSHVALIRDNQWQSLATAPAENFGVLSKLKPIFYGWMLYLDGIVSVLTNRVQLLSGLN